MVVSDERAEMLRQSNGPRRTPSASNVGQQRAAELVSHQPGLRASRGDVDQRSDPACGELDVGGGQVRCDDKSEVTVVKAKGREPSGTEMGDQVERLGRIQRRTPMNGDDQLVGDQLSLGVVASGHDLLAERPGKRKGSFAASTQLERRLRRPRCDQLDGPDRYAVPSPSGSNPLTLDDERKHVDAAIRIHEHGQL